MNEPHHMAEIWRGNVLESRHMGHVVVADSTGIRSAWGDPEAVILPRSSCKMVQALPLVASGAADAAGLGPRHLALSCASHSGADIHLDLVDCASLPADKLATNVPCNWGYVDGFKGPNEG